MNASGLRKHVLQIISGFLKQSKLALSSRTISKTSYRRPQIALCLLLLCFISTNTIQASQSPNRDR